MDTTRIITLGLLLLLAATPCQAEEGLLSGLWPFSPRSTPGAVATGPEVKSLDRSDLGLASPWSNSPVIEEKPSLSERFVDGTRSAWDNTVGRILPGKKQPPRSPYLRPERKKPSLWSRLFKPQSPYQPPQTLKEWQAQPRVGSIR